MPVIQHHHQTFLAALATVGLFGGLLLERSVHPVVGNDEVAGSAQWQEVVPGVLCSKGLPAAYALVDESRALLIDLPSAELLAGLRGQDIEPELLLLTHHHRHTAEGAFEARRQGISVRGPKSEAELLSPEGVAKYWQDSVPLRNSRTAHFVLAQGIPGVEATLEDGQKFAWGHWELEMLATPGHSSGHMSFSARRAREGSRLVFCGDALARPGTMWSPFTLEWDHWTDSGLRPAAQSLQRLAELEPTLLCPAHAPPITHDIRAALRSTISAIEEVAYLKSFERFSQDRLGDPPPYRFLAPDQVATGGEKPWTQLSDHLFLTGNTYLLVSRTGQTMAIDLWGKRSIEQVQKLVADRGWAMPEVVLASHAHYDHFDGIYEMPQRDRFEVWTLGQTARLLEQPGAYRHPFLDPRPMKVDRWLEDKEERGWREYRFRFHHLPGQTVFTMAVEGIIDGRRCLFTADNFFHMKQFSGSGGWTGLNRALPGGYAQSARKVLELAPEWVLAEHGGPFEFDAEDFRRRAAWAEAAGTAADRLCRSGRHRLDWDPHLVAIEPLWITARPGETVRVRLVSQAAILSEPGLGFTLDGRGLIRDLRLSAETVRASGTAAAPLEIEVHAQTPPGRHAFTARVTAGNTLLGTDTSLVVDVR